MNTKHPKLRNLKPRTPDAAVVAQIRKFRPHLSGPCPIRFYLYFPSEDAATKAASELRPHGFEVEIVPSIGSLKWLCLAIKEMVAETAALVEIRRDMVKLAYKYNGEYDGWEAEISDDSVGAG